MKDNDVPPPQRLRVVYEMDRVFGLKFEELRPEAQEADPEIDALVEERQQARKDRNFARADEIRDLLAERGIIIKDTPQGTVWSRKG